MNKTFIIFLISIVFTFLPQTMESLSAESNISVKFNYRGKSFFLQGKKTKQFTYLFNEGGFKKIRITTLDWAPYIGENICRQGWVQQLTIAMLASQGYEIVSTFYPWARTISSAEKGEADILYPEYFIESSAPSDVVKGTKRVENLALSERIPGGTIAFIKRKGDQDKYKGNFYNLKKEKIGVVRGYQNTPEFDALLDQNFFTTSEAVDDLMNARKLVGGRVNLIIGDPTVIRFSLINSSLDQRLKQKILDNIETVVPYIQYNHLYYAVSKKNPQWQQILETLNRTIAEFEASGELFRIIKDTNTSCGYEMESLKLFSTEQ